MTKTCGKCGHAALDDQAQFCNRCGAAVPEKRTPPFPFCPACGTAVPDELAQYCNRCGTKILPLPVLCSVCGSPAIDNLSRFCTRCGSPFDRQGMHSVHSTGPAPVIVTQRKPAGSHPAVIVPDTDWEPWNDAPAAPRLSGAADTVVPEQSARPDLQTAEPQKRYAHLPLVSDEMKKSGHGSTQRKKAVSQKKGVLGLLKK